MSTSGSKSPAFTSPALPMTIAGAPSSSRSAASIAVEVDPADVVARQLPHPSPADAEHAERLDVAGVHVAAAEHGDRRGRGHAEVVDVDARALGAPATRAPERDEVGHRGAGREHAAPCRRAGRRAPSASRSTPARAVRPAARRPTRPGSGRARSPASPHRGRRASCPRPRSGRTWAPRSGPRRRDRRSAPRAPSRRRRPARAAARRTWRPPRRRVGRGRVCRRCPPGSRPPRRRSDR